MTADERDRLQTLRAEGSDFEQLRVSPRKGSTLLARLAEAGRVGHTVKRLKSHTDNVRVAPFPTHVDFCYVSIVRCA